MMVYLDNAATTKLDKEVVDAVYPFFDNIYGNAASIHSAGREASSYILRAKEKIADILGCDYDEIFFTSGATESNNWAIIEAYNLMKYKGNHIITSKIEHESVLKSIEYLSKEYGVDVTYLDVDESGRISIENLKDAIRDDTILICCMYVNNETGVIQPVEQINDLIEGKNILFHCDCVQALYSIKFDLNKLGVSTASLSAHKIHGMKGSGILYIKKGIKYKSFIHGGSQQNGRRAGTENVMSTVAFAKAIEIARIQLDDNIKKLLMLKNYFLEKLCLNIPEIKLNGNIINSIPNILNVTIKDIDSEELLIALDMKGICASAGSACTSGSIDASYVLKAMGLNYADVRSSIRFSISKFTTKEEIDYTVDTLKEIVKDLRSFSINI